MTLLWRTLRDVGPWRLQRRLRYELRQHLDRRLPPAWALSLAQAASQPPAWCPPEPAGLSGLPLDAPPSNSPPPSLRFSFLRQDRELPWPIRWSDPSWPRLWQFHLLAFDWARNWLEQALLLHHWPAVAAPLPELLDRWVQANQPGRGDGWHSYTLSLRIRNWIWLFSCCPPLARPQRLRSLWQQILWLQAHPEHCHGGNHWLENLTALALGGLMFQGAEPQCVHERAMALLKQQLEVQLLADGGHEERSASYHLLMLDRLVELACVLAKRQERPTWLLQAITAMADWVQSVRLLSGKAPPCNDSAVDAAPPLDVVLGFARGFLEHRLPHPQCLEAHPADWALRYHLLRSAGIEQLPPEPPAVIAHPPVIDLPDTGWTLLRPGEGWELLFKCGVPCPPHLPAHVHSDQLGVDLFHHGRPVLAEAGTSIYGNGPDRTYERSGAAHNLLQLAPLSARPAEPAWFEPVEVWSSFRAGRKAQPRQRRCGVLADGGSFAEGSHDGYGSLSADHHRRLEVLEAQPDRITLRVVDKLHLGRPMRFRCWWHLAPGLDPAPLEHFSFEAPTAQDLQRSWHQTWLALGFGQRQPRRSRCLQGVLPIGQHQLYTVLSLPAPDALPTPCLASG